MKNRTLPNRVILSFTSPHFPYFYQKTISLSGEKLLLEYEIRNTGETPFPCLWAFHGLVRYEEDMEFFYSSDVQSFENVLDSLYKFKAIFVMSTSSNFVVTANLNLSQ